MHGLRTAFDGLVDTAAWLSGPSTHGILLACLALTFAFSGTAKARQRRLVAMTLVDFELARTVRPWAGTAVAALELSLAVALLCGVAAPDVGTAAAVTATALLVFFCGILARTLARGGNFACLCFGGDANGAHGISRATLLRTAALAALAGLCIPTATVPDGRTSAAQLLAAVALVGSVALVASARRLLEDHDHQHDHVGAEALAA